MGRLVVENALLWDPESAGPAPGGLLVEAGRIAAKLPVGEAGPPDVARVDLAGRALAPGFVDLHFHGRAVFARQGEELDAVRADAASLLRHGVTAYLPTTLAWEPERLRERVKSLASCVNAASWRGARPLGIHLEGPWLNPAAAGAQPGSGIRPGDPAELEDLLARAEGAIRMVTLAPETPGAGALLVALARHGVVAAMGHSHAEAGQIEAAVAEGLCHVTHLFNAMTPLRHRGLGVTGVALSDDRLTCDLIADGIHVDPGAVRVAARAKGEGLILISDRVEPPPGGSFGAGAVQELDGALRLADGTLAGSTLDLDTARRNVSAFGALDAMQALAAVTLRPARRLGVEAVHGTLRVGARADFAILGAGGEVEETWLAGRRVAPA